MSALTRWVLKRRAATILITVLVLCFGVFAIGQLQEELLPNVQFPYVFVTTVYPGASSQVVANTVTSPIEAAASQLSGVQTVQSKSLGSYSIVTVEFNFGTDVNSAEQQLSTKLHSLSLPTLSNGTQVQPSVSTFGFSNSPILYIAVQGNQGQSITALGQWANTVANPALSKQTDIGSVQVIGGTGQQVTITLNPAKLAAYGLSVNGVVSTLEADGVSFPAGTADVGGQSVPVNVAATFASPAALGQIVLVPNAGGASAAAAGRAGYGAAASGAAGTGATAAGAAGASQASQATGVTLADVATITPQAVYPNGQATVDGQQGILLQVYKSQNGNTVKASDATLAEISTLNNQYPAYHLTAVYDQAQSIRDSVSGLVREGILGAFFAILVIFLFLGNLRSTLVTAISIPTSILVALIVLWTQGITLNTLTLGGLAIAVGRVVDDAIVVLENIYRHVQMGEPIPEAVKNGTHEVAGAITSSTVTTVGVFLPLAFVGGLVGQFFVPFALTVTFALVASLLVALTVVPVFGATLITPKIARHAAEERETLLQKIYTPILRWGLGHRLATLGLAFLLLLGTLGSVAAFRLPTGFLPTSNTGLIQISVNPPQGADTSVTAASVSQAEQVLARFKQQGQISLYTSTITGGSSFGRQQQALSGRNTSASLLVTVPASLDTDTVAGDLRTALASAQPTGGSIDVSSASAFNSSTLSYIVQGPDAVAVKQGSDDVLNALQGVGNLANRHSDVSALTPQIVITPDPTKSAVANPALIGGQLAVLLQGQGAGTITFSDGTESQVLVQVPGPRGTDITSYIASLKALPLGGGLTLGDVATVQQIEGVTQVTRVNQALAATITADITTANTGQVTQAAAKAVAGLSLPAGVTVSQSGVGQQQSDAFSGLTIAMLAAVALVYIIMVLAFGSLLEPFAILFSLPLAAIGGLGALVLTHHELDISSLIGFLMLIGIVVTNAIVLMDLVNQLRRQGYDRHEALIRAGRTRVRPILMTAVATILALLPLALGIGGNEGGIIAADLGVVVIGGLLTSTLLTLVVVPVVYSLLDGLRARFVRPAAHPAPVAAPIGRPASPTVPLGNRQP